VTDDERHDSMSSLGEHELLPRTRRGHRLRTRCPWADPGPTDRYAPAPCGCECSDATGYRRRRHEYAHESPEGVRCVWCGRLRTWDPL
jgi:hypothetical protein